MQKILLTALIALFIFCGGAYALIWYSQASAAKSGLEQAIANLNAKQQVLTYESLEIKGFPADVQLALVKPHFQGRMDTLLKTLAANAPANASPSMQANQQFIENLPEWNEDILIDGTVVFSINALSDHYAMRASGDVIHKVKLGAKEFALSSHNAGDNVCTLDFERKGGAFGALWNFRAVIAEGRDFVHDFRALQCDIAPSETVNISDKQKTMSSGPARLMITSAPAGSTQNVRFQLSLKDSEVTDAGTALVSAYVESLAKESDYYKDYAKLGKQSIEMDFSYSGPTDIKQAGTNPTFDVRVDKFTFTNNAYNFDMRFQIANAMEGQNRHAKLDYSMTTSFGEIYQDLLQNSIRHALREVQEKNLPQYADMNAYLQKYSLDENAAIINAALPDLHSLGEIKNALAIDYSGNPEMTAGDVSLKDFTLSTGRYGLMAKGEAKLAAGQPIPQSTLHITCQACPAMIDDMAAYERRIQHMISYYAPEKAAGLYINPQLPEGFKLFLQALTEPAKENDAAGTYHYTLISDGKGGFTISGKRVDEVMALFQQYVAPYLGGAEPQAAPAS